ncbi:glucose-6-phosphate isomerase [Betaproteobacteria bacterium SCN2]|jgi:glucose-6-phosphate isomerase|nr:glucose-6-phosphate isomerase [Betaproteobacteria bacterium SCN2]
MLLSDLPTWKKLQTHRKAWDGVRMRALFEADPGRFERYSIRLDDFLLDYSKNLVNDETLALLRQLGHEANVPTWTEAMFSGEKINFTENRAVLHVALRNDPLKPILADGHDVMPGVLQVLNQMHRFTHAVREGKWRGHTGKIITDIVNIGIGGSDLGPMMACRALKHYGNARIKMHFVSNIDPNHVGDTLDDLNPETTLFIVSSKSFTTLETLANAKIARRWLVERLGSELAVARHFVAISTNEAAVKAFGIDPANMFVFWDWVGGRYSMWSAIGLPIALYVGMDHFEEMLAGARDMDEHFRADPLASIPGTLALLSIWYQHFWDAPSHAIFPYDIHLSRLPAYLQQLCMESNGKSTTRLGEKVNYPTGEIVWGEPGSNGQHAFFQLLHQGTRFVPTDFMLAAVSSHPFEGLHQMLVANCFAQTEALMLGKSEQEALAELKAEGADEETIRLLLPHKAFPGNKPSNTMLYQKLTPRTLGRLVALYEHKTFVQSTLWSINAFDQWGVEIGKRLSSALIKELGEDQTVTAHDASTNGLCAHYQQLKWK